MSETTSRNLPSKVSRHAAISRLLTENVVRSQSSLQDLLETASFNVTQATLSRDLEELGATKVRDREGNQRYVLVGSSEAGEVPLPLPGTLERWTARLLISSTAALNQVVLRTPPAAAPVLAAVIDKEALGGVLGCVAGDDTVLVICSNQDRATALCKELQQMASNGEGKNKEKNHD